MVFRPTAFGKYILLRRIAIGGMAEVFRAKVFGAEGFEKMVAIKRMLPHLSSDQQFVGMFINEAKLAASLTHANIVQIFDFGSIDNQYYLSMEYVRGKDVADIIRALRERSLRSPIEMACHVIIQSLNGLHYAHRRTDGQGQSVGLVHRDMSPHNLIVSYEGEVKILDFGIAKAKSSTVQTTGGVLKGKYSYMSPEQAHGMRVDHRTDIFSLGICFYELLTLTKMFQGQNDLSVLERVRETNFIRPRDLNPDIPEEVERLLLKALEKNPDDRWASAADWREALESFLFKAGLQYSPSWLGNFMHEIFRAEIGKEQAQAQDEDGRAEDLRLAARREARVEAIRASMASRHGGWPPIREVDEPVSAPNLDTQRAARPLEEERVERGLAGVEEPSGELPTRDRDRPAIPVEELDFQELPPVLHEVEDSMPTVELSRPQPARQSIPPRIRPAPPPPVGPSSGVEGALEGDGEEESTVQDERRAPMAVETTGERPLLGVEFEESLPTLRKPRTPASRPYPDTALAQPPPYADTTLVPPPRSGGQSDTTRPPLAGGGARSNLRLAAAAILTMVAVTAGVAWWLRDPPAPSSGVEEPDPVPRPQPAAVEEPGEAEGRPDAGPPPEPDAGLIAPGPPDAGLVGNGAPDAGVRVAEIEPVPPRPPPPQGRKRRPQCPSRGFGVLTVGVVGGWATVFVDGEKIKNTPLVDYSTRAGWRKVELRDGSGNVMRTWSVCLRANSKLKLLHQ
jgi:serine/threonine protein kinase